MKLAIHQPQYMPWSGYFHKMAGADLFVFLDDVQFKKNEWQHRNRIRGAQGWQWLSVPNHYKFPQFINEVTINNTIDWRIKHLRSLEMSYARAPFYSRYNESFKEYFSRQWETMDGVTISSARLLAGMFGIATPMEVSSAYGFEGAASERLVNICSHFGADVYLAGKGGRDYMDVALFEKAGIAVEFQDFSSPRYRQHWRKGDEDFIPDLSAIDVLFNCGPESLKVLMGT